jgi:hypothetical protein
VLVRDDPSDDWTSLRIVKRYWLVILLGAKRILSKNVLDAELSRRIIPSVIVSIQESTDAQKKEKRPSDYGEIKNRIVRR